MNRFRAVLFFFFVHVPFLFCFSFEVSPNEHGALDINVDHAWRWAGGFYSGFEAALVNPLDVNSAAQYYVATSGTSLETSVDILGYATEGRIPLDVAANVLYAPSKLREVGYIDLDDGSRLFLVNNRDITLILPRAKISSRLRFGPIIFTGSGSYAPKFSVTMNQSLETGSVGPSAEASHNSRSAGSGAWSLAAAAVLRGRYLSPEIEFETDYVPIEYSYLDSNSSIQNLDSLIRVTSVLGGFTLESPLFGSVKPRLLIGYEWTSTRDNETEKKIVDDKRFKIVVGMTLQ